MTQVLDKNGNVKTIRAPGSQTSDITIVIDGGGYTVTTGTKAQVNIDISCSITQWTLIADQSGSAVLDIKRSAYSTYPTTASMIGTGNAPTLSSVQKAQATPSGWSSNIINSGDVLEFIVSSCVTCTRLTLVLTVARTG